MTWLCGLKWSAIAIAWGVSLFVGCVVSYGFGWKIANRAYWKMMHRAGSKITRGF